jgi:hypothetical protein
MVVVVVMSASGALARLAHRSLPVGRARLDRSRPEPASNNGSVHVERNE